MTFRIKGYEARVSLLSIVIDNDITLNLISPLVQNICKNILSNSFRSCSGGAGNTVYVCINIGSAGFFTTHNLPSSNSDLNDRSLSNF